MLDSALTSRVMKAFCECDAAGEEATATSRSRVDTDERTKTQGREEGGAPLGAAARRVESLEGGVVDERFCVSL